MVWSKLLWDGILWKLILTFFTDVSSPESKLLPGQIHIPLQAITSTSECAGPAHSMTAGLVWGKEDLKYSFGVKIEQPWVLLGWEAYNLILGVRMLCGPVHLGRGLCIGLPAQVRADKSRPSLLSISWARSTHISPIEGLMKRVLTVSKK